jgi:exopolysaccharide biosynthesis polyprenyl glycosylphosphotransferase
LVVKLALLEATTLFGAVAAMIFVWRRPVLVDWMDAAILLGQALAVTTCCVAAFYYNDLYDLRLVRNFGAFAARLLQSFGVAFILLAAFYTAFPDIRIGSATFVSSVLLTIGFLVPVRAASYFVMQRRLFTERVLVVGTSALARNLITEIDARPQSRCVIVGIADDDAEQVPSRYPLLGPLARLEKIVEETRPHRIIVTMTERRGRLPVRELLAARGWGIEIDDGVTCYEGLAGKIAIESLTPSALVFSHDFRRSPIHSAVSRGLSFSIALTGLMGLAPLLALIALAIKLDSAGPMLFVHERVGLGGRRFKLLKFRTMRPSVTEASAWAGDNRDRITRVGRLLRTFRLDELPQFVNILRGDMNLVGPRPHPVSNYDLFSERIPYYSLRTTVRPGVTGWAQVRYGYANDLEEETEKMRYDLYYIKRRSAWLDLRILIDSVKIVLFGRGAR